PIGRTIEDASAPMCYTTWETNGLRISQTAFVTALDGTQPHGPVPAADSLTIFLARFLFTNISETQQTAVLPPNYKAGGATNLLRADDQGFLWLGESLRGQVIADPASAWQKDNLLWKRTLAPGETSSVVVKIP